MGSNLGYATSLQGIVKFISLVLVTISVALGFYAFFGSELSFSREGTKVELDLPWKEIFYMTITTLALIGGIIDIACHLGSQALLWDKRTAFVDFGFHAGSAALLFVSGFLIVISSVELHDDGCRPTNDCQLFSAKLAAASFGLLTGVSYAGAAVVVFTNRHDVER